MDDHTTRRRWLPNSTQIPNHFLDWVIQDLTESEMKVAFYILRRTFGFQKDGDRISLSQLVDGITRRDGRQLDRGTGLSRSSVVRGVKGLEARGLLQTHRTPGTAHNSPGTTFYSLLIEDAHPGTNLQPPPSQIETGASPELNGEVVPDLDQQNPDQKQESKEGIPSPTEQQIDWKRTQLRRLVGDLEEQRMYLHIAQVRETPGQILAALESAHYNLTRERRR